MNTLPLCQPQQNPYTVHGKRHNPGNAALHQYHTQCSPATAQFPLDSGNGCNTGGIQQRKDQENQRSKRGEQHVQRAGIAAQQDGQGGNNAFLGGKAGDQRSGNAPVAKAKGLEDGGDQAANQSQKAGIRGGSNIQAGVERL